MEKVPHKLRVGVAGAGNICKFHLTGWAAHERDAKVVAICDPQIERAKKLAQEFGIESVFANTEEMFAHPKLNAVDILTPVETHASLVRLAADQRLHIMCQKPITNTVAEAEELIAYVGERVRFMVHENHPFRTHFLQIKEWLAKGYVGKVTQARIITRSKGLISSNSETTPILNDQPFLKSLPRLLVFEILIHRIDVARTLFGPLTIISSHLEKLNNDVIGEDTAIITMRNQDGAIIIIDGTISAPGYDTLPMDQVEIIGTHATIKFDKGCLSLLGTNEPTIQYDLAKNFQAGFTNAIADFIHGLRNGIAFQSDRIQNLETLKLMVACYLKAGVKF